MNKCKEGFEDPREGKAEREIKSGAHTSTNLRMQTRILPIKAQKLPSNSYKMLLNTHLYFHCFIRRQI